MLSGIVEGQRETVVAMDSTDRIRVFEGAGKELWKSTDRYGGSTLYYAGKTTDSGEVERPDLPAHPAAAPAKQGRQAPHPDRQEPRHHGRGALEKFRAYNDSQIMAMYWDGLGLAQDWRTRKLTGCIRDFAVGDFNNDGGRTGGCRRPRRGRVIAATPKMHGDRAGV